MLSIFHIFICLILALDFTLYIIATFLFVRPVVILTIGKHVLRIISETHTYTCCTFFIVCFFCDIFTNQLIRFFKSFIKHHVDAFQFDMSCGD